jgi:hypothetical protein
MRTFNKKQEQEAGLGRPSLSSFEGEYYKSSPMERGRIEEAH